MQRGYQHTWESVPYLDADFMARWPAFGAGFTENIEFDDEGVRSAAFAMDADHDCFTIEYVDPHDSTADPLWSCIAVQRRPTPSNAVQRRPTPSNAVQRRPTPSMSVRW